MHAVSLFRPEQISNLIVWILLHIALSPPNAPTERRAIYFALMGVQVLRSLRRVDWAPVMDYVGTLRPSSTVACLLIIAGVTTAAFALSAFTCDRLGQTIISPFLTAGAWLFGAFAVLVCFGDSGSTIATTVFR
jgi:hypothetical protein